MRESRVPLAPLVEGVRQENFEELERTLLALEAEYSQARASADRERCAVCRRLVIEAKDHARLSLRRAADFEKRDAKQEMIEWMLVWLNDPATFPVWAKLRRRREHAEP